jgi:hypothetical protein
VAVASTLHHQQRPVAVVVAAELTPQDRPLAALAQAAKATAVGMLMVRRHPPIVPVVAVAANHPQERQQQPALAAQAATATPQHGLPALRLFSPVAAVVARTSQAPPVLVAPAVVVPVVPVVPVQPHQPQEAPTAAVVAAQA